MRIKMLLWVFFWWVCARENECNVFDEMFISWYSLRALLSFIIVAAISVTTVYNCFTNSKYQLQQNDLVIECKLHFKCWFWDCSILIMRSLISWGLLCNDIVWVLNISNIWSNIIWSNSLRAWNWLSNLVLCFWLACCPSVWSKSNPNCPGFRFCDSG